jgi:ATP-dependent Clp protease protease subunit
LAIYDTMRYIASPVGTTCMGMAASMGCFLLAAGHPGKRRSLPHARIMMHQPSQAGRSEGPAADIEIRAKEILYMREKMFELLARHTGQPLERIERDFDRDRWMAAPEARRYGMIDCVIDSAGSLADGEAKHAAIG